MTHSVSSVDDDSRYLGQRHRSRELIFAVLLIAVTLLSYRPAWHGTPLWDDAVHLTSPDLASWHGLARIWTELGATYQYYPVTYSAFWLMHLLWGDAPFGYHITSILLHTCSALLIAVILKRLAVPGAMLVAAIFALHPVHAESVAWMSEIKNTLSGVLYLLAAYVYLRFDDSRQKKLYVAATVLFVLAILAKSVTATLPAALLVLFWWQRGRLNWRRDVAPLVPLLVLGIGAGVLTAFAEHTFVGAHGSEFQSTAYQRVLVAGRAIWFYLGKLAWPVNLTFVYPKWTIDARSIAQALFPLAALALVAAAWMVRRRTRAPLAALLLFIGTLTPALGFVNVFPFRYSYVADHFQYLASVPIIALAAATASLALRRFAGGGAIPLAAVTALMAIGLGLMTWRQSAQYTDIETLYRETLRRDPESWFALNNLGERILSAGGDPSIAAQYLESSLKFYPSAEAHNNLGEAYRRLGRRDAALAEHQRAVAMQPTYPEAHNNLGTDLEERGDLDGAFAQYMEAVRLRPRLAVAQYNLGNLLLKRNRIDDAIAHLRTALEIRPDYGEWHKSLGRALEAANRIPEARVEYQQAVRLLPNDAVSRDNLGYALFLEGRHNEAIVQFREATRLNPGLASPHVNLGNVFLDQGKLEAAAAEYGLALAQTGLDGVTAAQTQNNLGVALAQLGRMAEARTHFEEALRLRPDFQNARDNLARAGGRQP